MRTVSPPLALASSSTVVAVESSDVAEAACSGYVAMPMLTVIGSRSVSSNWRLRSTSAACRRATSGSSSTDTAGGATMRNSSGPERPRTMGAATSRVSMPATASSAWSPASWPWFSLSNRKLSMSTSAIVTGPPAARAASVSMASRPTTVPWLSVPVSGSRREDSMSSAVWRVRRRWAVRKMRNSSAAAMSAADKRDEHDIAPDRCEPLQERHGITPDPDDAEHLAVDGDRQEFAQERRRAERVRTSLGALGREDRGLRLAADREGELGADRHRGPADRGVARGHDRAVWRAQLDAQDLPGSDERREL